MVRDILNHLGIVVGQLELPDNTSEQEWAAILAQYALPPDDSQPEPIVTSFAVDKMETDQEIFGTNWTKIESKRLLWDVESGFELVDSMFNVKKTGIYNYDFQLQLNNLINIHSIEIALFQYVDGIEDDYWFTLKRETKHAADTVMHLGGMTQFDFFTGEKYYIALKLIPLDDQLPCSAIISGSDDHTAWGASFSSIIMNSYRS